MQGSRNRYYSVVRGYMYIILRNLGRLNELWASVCRRDPRRSSAALDTVHGNSEVGIDDLPLTISAGTP